MNLLYKQKNTVSLHYSGQTKENEELTAAVKFLNGPTLTVRGGKCGPLCIPERTGHRQT